MARSQRIEPAITAAFIGGGLALLSALIGLFFIVWAGPEGKSPSASISIEPLPVGFWIAVLATITLGLIGAGYLTYRRIRIRQDEVANDAALLAAEQERIESASGRLSEKMELGNLVELNRLLLGSYHRIATEQAESSFRSSRRAMWGGFTWLLACFTAALALSASVGAQVLIGALAAIGGALSGFLSRTYIRVYERALIQLNQYFNQPLLNSYLLSAERIIKLMSDGTRDRSYEALLNQLLRSGDGLRGPLDTTPNGVTDHHRKRDRHAAGSQNGAQAQLGADSAPTANSQDHP